MTNQEWQHLAKVLGIALIMASGIAMTAHALTKTPAEGGLQGCLGVAIVGIGLWILGILR